MLRAYTRQQLSLAIHRLDTLTAIVPLLLMRMDLAPSIELTERMDALAGARNALHAPADDAEGLHLAKRAHEVIQEHVGAIFALAVEHLTPVGKRKQRAYAHRAAALVTLKQKLDVATRDILAVVNDPLVDFSEVNAEAIVQGLERCAKAVHDEVGAIMFDHLEALLTLNET